MPYEIYDEGECGSVGGYWYNGVCYYDAEESCNLNNGYWYESTCYTSEEDCCFQTGRYWYEGVCYYDAETCCNQTGRYWYEGVCYLNEEDCCNQTGGFWYEGVCYDSEAGCCEQTDRYWYNGVCYPDEETCCNQTNGYWDEENQECSRFFSAEHEGSGDAESAAVRPLRHISLSDTGAGAVSSEAFSLSQKIVHTGSGQSGSVSLMQNIQCSGHGNAVLNFDRPLRHTSIIHAGSGDVLSTVNQEKTVGLLHTGAGEFEIGYRLCRSIIDNLLNRSTQEIVFSLLTSVGTEICEIILNSLADKKQLFFKSLNELLQGDPAEIINPAVNSIVNEKSKISNILNTLSGTDRIISLILNELSDKTPAELIIRSVNSLTNEKSFQSKILNELSGNNRIFSLILNTLSDTNPTESIIRVINTLADEKHLQSKALNELSDKEQLINIILNELSDREQLINIVLNELSDTIPAELITRSVNSLINTRIIQSKILNNLSDREQLINIVLNELSDTIPAELITRSVNSLINTRIIQSKILNNLSDREQLINIVLNELSDTVPVELITRSVNSLINTRFIISDSINTLSGYNVLFQNIINELSDKIPSEHIIRAVNSLINEKSVLTKSLNTLSDRNQIIQNSINELTSGVPTELTIRAVNSLVSEQVLLAHILNTFADKTEKICQILNILSDPPEHMTDSILNDMSDFEPAMLISSIINEYEMENAVTGNIGIGDNTTSPETDPVLIPATGISTGIITSVSNNTTQYAVISNDGTVSGSATGQIDVSTGEWVTPLVWENPVDTGTEIVSTAAALPNSLYIVPYDIFLDGVSIKNRITKCQITHRRDVVHNEITIESMDQHLKTIAQKDVSKTLTRFEVHLPDSDGGTRFIYFLLEKLGESDEIHFSLYGRSLSALEDEDFNDKEEYFYLESPTSAKSVAESLLKHNTLEWKCPDWILPTEFEYEGAPIVGVQKIAEFAGCILRAGDDNTLFIEPRKKERPINMENTIPDLIYDRSVAMSINSDDEKGDGYDTVDVIGWADDIESPDIEQEEDSPSTGQAVHLRVFWNGKKPTGTALKVFELIELDNDEFDSELIESASEPVETFVTAGKIADLGLYQETYGIDPETKEKQIYTFSEGKVSVEHPIVSLESVKFIGNPVPPPEVILKPSFEKYSKDITLGSDVYVLANIIYKSEYQRYLCYAHSISDLLALWMITNEGISAKVTIGNGTNPAPAIEDNLLTSHEILLFRATNFIDNCRYNTKKRSARFRFYRLA